jgi:hypothetical protein
VCGDLLSHLQTVVCSPHCRSIHNFGVKVVHTQAMKDRLAVMWHAGEKTAVIALELGVSVNVIVSLRRRIPLPARPSPIRLKGSGKVRTRTPQGLPQRLAHVALSGRTLPPIDAPVFDWSLWSAPPKVPPKPIQRAPEPKPSQMPPSPHKTCQFIFNDDPHNPQFCGKLTKPGSSYCPECYARCYIRTPKMNEWSAAA